MNRFYLSNSPRVIQSIVALTMDEHGFQLKTVIVFSCLPRDTMSCSSLESQSKGEEGVDEGGGRGTND